MSLTMTLQSAVRALTRTHAGVELEPAVAHQTQRHSLIMALDAVKLGCHGLLIFLGIEPPRIRSEYSLGGIASSLHSQTKYATGRLHPALLLN